MVILEFSLAVIFICLMISLFTSWIIDYMFSILNQKGILLKRMLTMLLDDDKSNIWVTSLYAHPMIKSLSFSNKRLTSYIPANIFANVIADLVIPNSISTSHINNDAKIIEQIRNGLQLLPKGELKHTLGLFLAKAGNNSNIFLEELESWYNEYMKRVNHAYKRRLKFPLMLTGFIVAVSFNIDMIQIASNLWTDTPMRNNITGLAEKFVAENDEIETSNITKDFFENYEKQMALSVGWDYEREYRYQLKKKDKNFSTSYYWLQKFFGFLITGLIASFGAPFWYDALQNILGLKKSIKQ